MSTPGANAPSPDPAFVFDFTQVADPSAGQRWSTWGSIERLCRGPEPRPDWVVTDLSAIDTELGVLKTGKEADVCLIDRTSTNDPASTAVLAAKRYRPPERRSFHRSAAYTEGRRTRRSRDTRALAKKTSHGRDVAAGQWAYVEWEALCRFHGAGIPVPYPVQIDGTEILMEFVRDDGGDSDGDLAGNRGAPRLVQSRGDRQILQWWYDQLRDAIIDIAQLGLAHGDLSAYNVLVAGDRLVIIDLPQAVDIVGNPFGMEFLHRDCRNVCDWFARRGLHVDGDELFAEVLGHI